MYCSTRESQEIHIHHDLDVMWKTEAGATFMSSVLACKKKLSKEKYTDMMVKGKGIMIRHLMKMEHKQV